VSPLLRIIKPVDYNGLDLIFLRVASAMPKSPFIDRFDMESPVAAHLKAGNSFRLASR
jgi:hypothetical protein